MGDHGDRSREQGSSWLRVASRKVSRGWIDMKCMHGTERACGLLLGTLHAAQRERYQAYLTNSLR